MKEKKTQELEEILKELNTGISEDKRVGEEKENTSNEDLPANKTTEQKQSYTSEKKKKNAKSAKKNNRPINADFTEQLHQKLEEAEEFVEEERRSFVESARIIEEQMEDLQDEEDTDPYGKHIVVTSVEEVEEPEQTEPPEKKEEKVIKRRTPHKKPKKSRKEIWMAVIGLFVTIFVIIGLVCTIAGTVQLTGDLINSTSQKKELAKEIFPLVIVDIPEFDSAKNLDNSAIISSSIWAFIIDDNDKSKYTKDDLGAIYVPDVDIELYIRKLYGNDVPIKHQSVEDSSVHMFYDEEKRSYIVESALKFLPYIPQVDKISKNADLYTLQVSYVLPDPMWNLESDKSSTTIDKVMIYELKKNGDSYQVLSVKIDKELTKKALEASGQRVNSELITPPAEDVLEESSDIVSEPALDESSQESTDNSEESSQADADDSSEAASDKTD